MTYFAAALARQGLDWTGEEIDLDGVEDLDGVIDVMRQATGDDVLTSLLFLEENDEWFGIVRLDEDSDPRVFVSDGRMVETSSLGALLAEAATVNDDVGLIDGGDDDSSDDDDNDEPIRIAGDPVGDAELLNDLGTPGSQLQKLAAEEGKLPADILSALAEAAGCLEVLDSLREG